MTSAIRQLLDEISWEGNARRYRGGGLGKENVLTVEVFQALRLLPRSYFLGPMLKGVVTGDSSLSEALATDAEDLSVEVLPGDVTTTDGSVRVQPDVLISSGSTLTLVEAKAFRRAGFQPEQLGRELLVARDLARGRFPLLLLVLDAEPPVLVKGRGRQSVTAALESDLELLAARGIDTSATTVEVRWVTWHSLASQVKAAAATFVNADPSIERTIHRLANDVIDAVNVHSGAAN